VSGHDGSAPILVLVVPIVPAATGNGLAMRAGMLLESLADGNLVHVVRRALAQARAKS
jgi:hypothetical protein